MLCKGGAGGACTGLARERLGASGGDCRHPEAGGWSPRASGIPGKLTGTKAHRGYVSTIRRWASDLPPSVLLSQPLLPPLPVSPTLSFLTTSDSSL